MNQKTSKLLRRFAFESGFNLKAVKRNWYKNSPRKRGLLRKQIRDLI